jgi:hypothetical protein
MTVQEALPGFDLKAWEDEGTRLAQVLRFRSALGARALHVRVNDLLDAARLQIECGWQTTDGADAEAAKLLAEARQAIDADSWTPARLEKALRQLQAESPGDHIVLHSFAFVAPVAGRIIDALAKGSRVTRVEVLPDAGRPDPVVTSHVSLAALLAEVRSQIPDGLSVCLSMPRASIMDVERTYLGDSFEGAYLPLNVLADIASNPAWTVRPGHVARWLEQGSPDGSAVFSDLRGYFEDCGSVSAWRLRAAQLSRLLRHDVRIPHHPVSAHSSLNVSISFEGPLLALLASVEQLQGYRTIEQVMEHPLVRGVASQLFPLVERGMYAGVPCDGPAIAAVLRAAAAAIPVKEGPSFSFLPRTLKKRRLQPWGWMFEVPYRPRPTDLLVACLDAERFPGRAWQLPWPLELAWCPEGLPRACIEERMQRHGEVARRILAVAAQSATGKVTWSWCEEMEGRATATSLRLSGDATSSLARAPWPDPATNPSEAARRAVPQWIHDAARASRARHASTQVRKNPVPTANRTTEDGLDAWYRMVEEGAWKVCPRLGALNAVRGQSLVYRERLHRYRLLTRMQGMGGRNILGEHWKERLSEVLEPAWPEPQRVGAISDEPAPVAGAPGRQHFVHRAVAVMAADTGARVEVPDHAAPATPGLWCTWCPERQGCSRAHPPGSIDDRARTKVAERFSVEADVDDTNRSSKK